MKIWIVNQYALPPWETGGTRHYSLARELVSMGHQVCIIASNIHYSSRIKMKECHGSKNIEGVQFIWLDSPVYKKNSIDRIFNMIVFTYRLLLTNKVRSLFKPDIIIGSSPHPFSAWAAERLSYFYKVPFVLEIRDLWPETLINIGKISSQNLFIKLLVCLEKYLYKKADRIVVLPSLAGEYIVNRYNIDGKKIICIPNGVDLNSVLLQVESRNEDIFTVMYIGSHGLYDGLDILLNVASIIKYQEWGVNIRFRFIGSGPEKSNLYKKAKELGLNNIHFEDPVSKTQIFKVLKEADVCIAIAIKSPLYRWGLSFNKLYDYMASARPVILGADVADDIVKLSGAGISVQPDDLQAIALAIKEIKEMKYSQRFELGLKGRAYVEKNNSYRNLASKLEKLLCDL